MKRLQMSGLSGKDKYILLDDNDYEWAKEYKWYLNIGRPTRFIKNKGNQSSVLMHREIMGFPKKMDIDHIDHDQLNNQRNNLRICTTTQNVEYRITTKHKSGYKGVYKNNAGNKWGAKIVHKKKTYLLGSFETKIEAAKHYDNAAIKLHKEFALINGV